MRKFVVVAILLLLLVSVVACAEAIAFTPTGDPVNDIRNYLVADMVSRGYVNPVAEVTYMNKGTYEAYMQCDDPDGDFIGMRFRVTVNYNGTGTPQFYGGFE
jgi:hypothetical protein